MPAAGTPRKSLLLDVPVVGRIPWVCLERGHLHVDGHALAFVCDAGTIEIPVASFASIILEPGVSTSHESIRLCAENRVLVIWAGEAGTRLYAASGVHANCERLIAQARLHENNQARIEAARRLYTIMFGERPPPSFSIEKLRGLEGSRVRAWYAAQAQEHGLEWDGRASASALQQTISYATGCLYSVAEIAAVLLGFSPALGVVHRGDPRSFVYDLADSVKFSVFLPEVFRWMAASGLMPYSDVRRRCRDFFRSATLLDTLILNAETITHGDDPRSSQQT